MSFFSEIPKYLTKKLHNILTFTKAYLYQTVGEILFLKPYRPIFDFCGLLLLKIHGEYYPMGILRSPAKAELITRGLL